MPGRSRAPIAIAAAIGAHLTALRAGFVWLDHAHIEDRAALVEKGDLVSAFTHGFAGTGYYRPLVSLSLSLDAALGGPLVFHATNLLLHAAAAAMTTVAGEALGLTRRAALFAGVLFAVHPLSSLVASAIAFRSESLLVIALLGLVWAHVRERPLLAAAAVAVAALTKETGLALAPLLVVALALGRRAQGSPAARPPLRPKLLVAEALALAACVALRVRFAPSWRASHEPLSAADALGTRLASIGKAGAAVLLPIDRGVCDAFSVTHPWQPGAVAGLAILVVIAILAWRERGVALLLALSLLPMLQLVPVARWWSPHYLYLPFAFVAMRVGAFVEERLGKTSVRVVGGAAALLGALSLHDGLRYLDDTELWAPEVKRQPTCLEGQFYLGEVERLAKRWEPAARRYEAALAPRAGVLAYVDRGAALQNLGTVRLEQGRHAEARRAFASALEGTRDPSRRRELTHDLAAAALGEGDAADALRLLEPELARPDAMKPSLALAASALERLGRAGEAEALRARAR
ncbi:MAG: hypothetical protein JST00_16300 [Deltaproteobacteria bacterium]|nr:hypothetical protein [Deltaproteobacteria bacterium]